MSSTATENTAGDIVDNPRRITLAPGQKVMAHNILFNGIYHRLAVAAADTAGNITIAPFHEETPSTTFINGTIEIIPPQ